MKTDPHTYPLTVMLGCSEGYDVLLSQLLTFGDYVFGVVRYEDKLLPRGEKSSRQWKSKTSISFSGLSCFNLKNGPCGSNLKSQSQTLS